MLVRLTSSTSGEIILFAEQARRLFEIIGKEGTARGVFTLQQLPEAIASLRHAVEDEKRVASQAPEEKHARQESDRDASEDDGDEKTRNAVRLAQRAQPLIHLMEWTHKEKGFILWEAATDF